MKICNACGKPLQGGIWIGTAMLCFCCAEDVRAEIDTLRAKGKPVNALEIARRIYRETYSAGNYLLRDVPEDLMAAINHKALDEGVSARDLVLKALRTYLA